jgi:hypothetical protein
MITLRRLASRLVRKLKKGKVPCQEQLRRARSESSGKAYSNTPSIANTARTSSRRGLKSELLGNLGLP